MVDSESGGTGFGSRCGRYLSLVHTYAVTQTVQIHGIIMTTERITNSHRTKKRTKKNKEIKMTNMSKLTCERSIKPLYTASATQGLSLPQQLIYSGIPHIYSRLIIYSPRVIISTLNIKQPHTTNKPKINIKMY